MRRTSGILKWINEDVGGEKLKGMDEKLEMGSEEVRVRMRILKGLMRNEDVY